ncbi:MAG: riboflavin synthase [Candidatus Krumholzibacteriia bacterium]
MFTGLVREVGRLRGVRRRAGLTRLDVHAPELAPRLAAGDSVAVNGICLTVTRPGRTGFTVDAAAETRRVTTLPRWRPGDPLHLEPALRAGDPLDGHLVLGHVDGTGRLAALRNAGGSLFLTFSLAPELARYLLPKGSVAVDGVSLTVDRGPFRDRFTVNLVPHTLRWTSFDRIRVGKSVNLEMDVLVKAARSGDGLRGAWAGVPAQPDASRDASARAPSVRSLTEILDRGWRRGAKGR